MSDRHAANLAKVQRLRALVERQSRLVTFESWVCEDAGTHTCGAGDAPWGHEPGCVLLDVCDVGDPKFAAFIVAAVNALPAVVVDVEGRLAVHTRREHALPGVSGHVCTRCRDPWPCADYLAAERVLDALKEA